MSSQAHSDRILTWIIALAEYEMRPTATLPKHSAFAYDVDVWNLRCEGEKLRVGVIFGSSVTPYLLDRFGVAEGAERPAHAPTEEEPDMIFQLEKRDSYLSLVELLQDSDLSSEPKEVALLLADFLERYPNPWGYRFGGAPTKEDISALKDWNAVGRSEMVNLLRGPSTHSSTGYVLAAWLELFRPTKPRGGRKTPRYEQTGGQAIRLDYRLLRKQQIPKERAITILLERHGDHLETTIPDIVDGKGSRSSRS